MDMTTSPVLLLLRPFFVVTIALLLSGCDPLVSLQGSFWPPWIIVMVAALPMTALAHRGPESLGLAEHLSPPVIVYPALWALMTFIGWLIAFQW